MAVGIRGYDSMYSGGTYRVRMGSVPAWENAYYNDPEWREFLNLKRLRKSGWTTKDTQAAWSEYSFQKQYKIDLARAREQKRREGIYAAAGMEYKPVSGVITSVKSSGPSASSLKRKEEREQRKAEIKSKQAEKADAKKLREIEQQGRDLLKKRNEYAQRPGYGEEVERLNEQLAELAFERDYLAGRSSTLKTAEERRREAAESESQIAARESLVQQRKSAAEREKEADRVRREVSAWIAQNPNNPAVASINKLMSQSKMSGVDPLAIVLQAKALADAEMAKTEERARLQTERLQAMQDRQEDAQAFRQESERARSAERMGARSAAQQQKVVEFIQKLDARIAGLETMIEDARSADPTLEPDVASRIPGAERELAGLQAERDAWQQMLEANYGSANTDFTRGSSGQPVRVNSIEELNALPSGSLYIGPDGVTRSKP